MTIQGSNAFEVKGFSMIATAAGTATVEQVKALDTRVDRPVILQTLANMGASGSRFIIEDVSMNLEASHRLFDPVRHDFDKLAVDEDGTVRFGDGDMSIKVLEQDQVLAGAMTTEGGVGVDTLICEMENDDKAMDKLSRRFVKFVRWAAK